HAAGRRARARRPAAVSGPGRRSGGAGSGIRRFIRFIRFIRVAGVVSRAGFRAGRTVSVVAELTAAPLIDTAAVSHPKRPPSRFPGSARVARRRPCSARPPRIRRNRRAARTAGQRRSAAA
ncbi:hypothetical protein, partial [Burkholderia pseudomallei]|uniref:hypothetical protein n=1 Tax=Burkholderia pseudomallei TaxID=28450 RepID=UPI0023796783